MFIASFIYTPGQYDDEFHRLNAIIDAVAKSLPGFLGTESWQSTNNNRRNATYYWRDLDTLKAFSTHPVHQEAKRQYAKWYEGYHIVISEVIRSYGDGSLAHVTPNDRTQGAEAHDRSILKEKIAQAGLRIVPFAPALRAYFYDLNAAWLKRYFYLEDIDHRVLSEPETEILAPGGAILFALLDTTVVGTCALKYESPGVYELTKMAVTEQYQGQGIGRNLLQAAIAEFKRRDGRTLFLESSKKLLPALKLYESMGFKHQTTSKPNSDYRRADVYMIWQDTATHS